MTGLEIMGAVAAVAAFATLGAGWWVQRMASKGWRALALKLADDLAYVQGRLSKQSGEVFDLDSKAHRHSRALEAIAAATADINHGTARKVHRMAKEGLK